MVAVAQTSKGISISEAQKTPQPKLKPGEVDAKGRLILYVAGGFPLRLEDDFGVLVVNQGDEKAPQATYILGERATRKLTTTQNRNQFFQALAGLPRHSRIRWYDTCTVSLTHGLPRKAVREVERKLAKLGHLAEEDPNITDICVDGVRLMKND